VYLGAVGLALLAATGCATQQNLHAQALPGAGTRVRALERVYVEAHAEDTRGVHQVIRNVISGAGIEADSGPAPAPEGYDAVVTYLDRYQWDITTYCIQLTIYVRDAQTGFVIGTGSSFATSIVRKSPAEHARTIVAGIFARSP
jgi:hypothetical protein